MSYRNWFSKEKIAGCFCVLLLLHTVICIIVAAFYKYKLQDSAINDFNHKPLPSSDNTNLTCAQNTTLTGEQLTDSDICPNLILSVCVELCNTIVHTGSVAKTLVWIGIVPGAVVSALSCFSIFNRAPARNSANANSDQYVAMTTPPDNSQQASKPPSVNVP